MNDIIRYEENVMTQIEGELARAQHTQEALSALYDDAVRDGDPVDDLLLRQKTNNDMIAELEDKLVNAMTLGGEI